MQETFSIYRINIIYAKTDKSGFETKVYAANEAQASEIGRQLFKDKIRQEDLMILECKITKRGNVKP